MHSVLHSCILVDMPGNNKIAGIGLARDATPASKIVVWLLATSGREEPGTHRAAAALVTAPIEIGPSRALVCAFSPHLKALEEIQTVLNVTTSHEPVLASMV